MTSTPQSRWICCASLLCEPIGTACPLHPPATAASQHVSLSLSSTSTITGHHRGEGLCIFSPHSWWLDGVLFQSDGNSDLTPLRSSRPRTARSSPVSCCDGRDEEPGLHRLEPRDPGQQLSSSARLRRPLAFQHKVLIYASVFISCQTFCFFLVCLFHNNDLTW